MQNEYKIVWNARYLQKFIKCICIIIDEIEYTYYDI